MRAGSSSSQYGGGRALQQDTEWLHQYLPFYQVNIPSAPAWLPLPVQELSGIAEYSESGVGCYGGRPSCEAGDLQGELQHLLARTDQTVRLASSWAGLSQQILDMAVEGETELEPL